MLYTGGTQDIHIRVTHHHNFPPRRKSKELHDLLNRIISTWNPAIQLSQNCSFLFTGTVHNWAV